MLPATFNCDGGNTWKGGIAADFKDRLRGWIGRRPALNFQCILLFPCRSVHFWGTFEPLDLVFLRPDGTVVRHLRNLAPYSLPKTEIRAWAVWEVASVFCPIEWNPRHISWSLP